MVLPLLHVAKVLAKGQVADEVECDEVEPLDHVGHAAGFCALGELLDHEADVVLDDALLGADGFLGEGVA